MNLNMGYCEHKRRKENVNNYSFEYLCSYFSRFLFYIDPLSNEATDSRVPKSIFAKSKYASKHRYVAYIKR